MFGNYLYWSIGSLTSQPDILRTQSQLLRMTNGTPITDKSESEDQRNMAPMDYDAIRRSPAPDCVCDCRTCITLHALHRMDESTDHVNRFVEFGFDSVLRRYTMASLTDRTDGLIVKA